MAAIRGADQSPIVSQRYLNTTAWTGDRGPGTVVKTSDVSGSIVQPYTGQLGGILSLGSGPGTNQSDAAYYSDPTATKALKAGDYQYVQFLSTSVRSNAPGQVVFWSDKTNKIVTPDAGAAGSAEIAGITLCTPAKGNYWFIQISGTAAVLFNSSVTATTPAVGDVIQLFNNTSNLADDPTQSGNITFAIWGLLLGNADEAPAAGVLKFVRLRIPALGIYA